MNKLKEYIKLKEENFILKKQEDENKKNRFEIIEDCLLLSNLKYSKFVSSEKSSPDICVSKIINVEMSELFPNLISFNPQSLIPKVFKLVLLVKSNKQISVPQMLKLLNFSKPLTSSSSISQ